MYNVPDYSSTSVAELCIGLTLAVYREIPAGDAAIRSKGPWAISTGGTELRGTFDGFSDRPHAFTRSWYHHYCSLFAGAARGEHIALFGKLQDGAKVGTRRMGLGLRARRWSTSESPPPTPTPTTTTPNQRWHAGKTVGIFGTGSIGQATARLFSAFGCNIIGYSRTERAEFTELGGTYVDRETLFSTADVLSVHIPFTKDTAKCIGAEDLHLLKPSAVFINTARGTVVDEEALAECLAANRFRAGLDVFAQEPVCPQICVVLWALSRVLC